MFKAGDWLHCGELKNGVYQEGRKVSVNQRSKILKLTNQKFLSDGSVLKKIERFSKQGVERDLTIDGQKIAATVPRLNKSNARNWLSMQPDALRYEKYSSFGEINEDNYLHGRGIYIYLDGSIRIGFW